MLARAFRGQKIQHTRGTQQISDINHCVSSYIVLSDPRDKMHEY